MFNYKLLMIFLIIISFTKENYAQISIKKNSDQHDNSTEINDSKLIKVKELNKNDIEDIEKFQKRIRVKYFFDNNSETEESNEKLNFLNKTNSLDKNINSENYKLVDIKNKTNEEVIMNLDDKNLDECYVAEEKEIISLFDKWSKALESGDEKKVMENYSKESMLSPILSDTVFFKLDDIKNYYTNFLRNEPSLKLQKRSIETDCNVGFETGIYRLNIIDSPPSDVEYSILYKKKGTNWFISNHYSSKIEDLTSVDNSFVEKKEKVKNFKDGDSLLELNNSKFLSKNWIRFP